LSYYKVRFHLARGENYMKWQISKDKEKPNYVDPDQFRIVMKGCLLKNNKRLAKEIHQGQNKKVCAWILCESIELFDTMGSTPTGMKITYNPRRNPFWTDGISNLDDRRCSQISSKGRELFADVLMR
jgi:hypothetical protein